MKKKQLIMNIKKCNELTRKFGVSLSDEAIERLINKRFEALKNTGRIEFDEGILKKLIEAFCDSPYIIFLKEKPWSRYLMMNLLSL